ncbi:MAG: energy-coupling factor transporter transmembrane component T [Candidatus Zixiibacteriota bacterium]
MTGQFIIGQYQPSDSFGHRLDPRTKIIIAAVLMMLSIFTTSLSFYIPIIILTFGFLLLSKITMGKIYENLKPLFVLIIITALYHLLFSSRDSSVLWNIFGFNITEGGVRLATVYSLRLLVFVGLAFFISLTTLPSDFAMTLVNWLKPFKRFKLPVNDIGLIVFIAMRFIPVLAEEFETIKKAQIVRGVNFGGSLVNRGQKMLTLFIPVLRSAIRRADDLAIAIESRGYVSGGERSSYRQFHWQFTDWFFMVGALSLAILIFYLTNK